MTYEAQLVAVCLWIVQCAYPNAMHAVWQWFLSTKLATLLKKVYAYIAHIWFKIEGGSVGKSLDIPPFEGLSKIFVTYVIRSSA